MRTGSGALGGKAISAWIGRTGKSSNKRLLVCRSLLVQTLIPEGTIKGKEELERVGQIKRWRHVIDIKNPSENGCPGNSRLLTLPEMNGCQHSS